MKKLFGILMVATALLLPQVTSAADQYGIDATYAPSSYTHATMITNGTALWCPPILVTNIPVHVAKIMPVPKDGFGVYFRSGGTNSTATTNLTITLEGVIFTSSGVTQVVDNATFSIVATATTLPTGHDYLTNFPALNSGLAGVLNRCDGIRVRSIENTNTTSLWLTNLFQLR
jgi:hypothetical protein